MKRMMVKQTLINDITVPYGNAEEEVENAIQENMIEADTVTNDLRKELELFGVHPLLTYHEDMLGLIFAHVYPSHGLLQNINVGYIQKTQGSL